MISIKDRLAELERCHRWRAITLECYRAAIADAAQYAVALDDETTERHRKFLADLAGEVTDATRPDELLERRATLRALLRDYSEKAARYMGEMREGRAGAERALQEILASLMQADDDHDGRIRLALGHLRTVSQSPEGRFLREVLRAATDVIERSMDQIRKEHQLAITRFQTEIRGLLERLDPSRAAARAESLTNLFDRAEIEERISAASHGEFLLVLLRARGVRLAGVQLGNDVAGQRVTAFVVRLRNTLPINAEIGRWGEEEFIALVSTAAAAVSSSSICKRIMENLPGPYGCVLNGKVVRPSIEISVCGVNSALQDPEERIQDRIEGFFARI